MDEPAHQTDPIRESTLAEPPINTKASSLFGRCLRATLLDHTLAAFILVPFLFLVLPIFKDVPIGFATGFLLVATLFTLMEMGRKKASMGLSLMGLTLGKEVGVFRLFWRNLLRFLPVMTLLGLLTAVLLGEPLEALIKWALMATVLAMLYNVFSVNLGYDALHNQLSGVKVGVVAAPRYGKWFLSLVAWWMLGGIGIAIALPNFIGACDASPVYSVKASMHTLQTMVETYAVDWKGQYPPSIQMLEKEANQPDKTYWKNITNPLTHYQGYRKSYANESDPKSEGIATYEAVGPHFTIYYIYGYDKKGQRIQNKGQDFILTNS